MLTLALRYFNTIRYLKLVQLKSLILKRLRFKRLRSLRGELKYRYPRYPIKDFIKKPQSIFPDFEFSFFGSSSFLHQVSWAGSQKSDLWRYNQHYFDDLCSDVTGQRRKLQLDTINLWISQNIPGSKPGWDAYPTSLRIVNWIKYDLSYQSLNASHIKSIYNQSLCLEDNIEWHLLGNHLFANAKALIFSGLYFQGDTPKNWLTKGANILKVQIQEQILEDGGHFELSPMYHAIILEDLLDLINIFEAFEVKQNHELKHLHMQIRKAALKMLHWSSVMLHPDGRLPFFNDTAINISAPFGALFDYAKSLDLGLLKISEYEEVKLENSGFYIWKNGSSKLFFDVGEIGASYLPGHAHADTLSIECSINGKNLIVNSGTSDYAVSELRAYQRSTAAHSTVEINGENSSETWSSFRVARRAKIVDRSSFKSNQSVFFSASHDGYYRFPGKYIHTRRIKCNSKLIEILDKVTGMSYGNLKINFFLAPEIKSEKLGSRLYKLSNITGEIDATIEFSDGEVELKDTFWYPRFGEQKKNTKLQVKFSGDMPKQIITKLIWIS